MPASGNISLREYIEQHQRAHAREHELLEKNTQERLAGAERALELQAKENERRLDILNHAHDQAIEAASATVPREIYDANIREIRSLIENNRNDYNERIEELRKYVDKRIADLVLELKPIQVQQAIDTALISNNRSTTALKVAIIGTTVSAIIGIISIVLRAFGI